MKAFKQPSKIVSLALLCFFLIPYFIFLKYFNLDFSFNFSELWWAFKNSCLQAFGAAGIVTLLSIPMSWGLINLKPRRMAFVQKLLLIPQILPALFSILIIFSLVQPFPMGTLGIILIFVTIHLGFAIVLMAGGTRETLGTYTITAETFAVGRTAFLRKIYFPLMRPYILTIFTLVFIYCFASFSVPLVAGGGRGTNIEVLIFEKIFINQNWSMAWTLSLLQSLFILIVSFLVLKKTRSKNKEFEIGTYLNFNWAFIGILCYLGIYGSGYLIGLVNSMSSIPQFRTFSTEILMATARSFQILFLYLTASFAILILWLYDFVLNGKQNSARHLLATSTVLVGFAFYLLFPTTDSSDYLKIILAMTILIFPPLFRSFLERPIDDLYSQIETAQVFGIRSEKIISTIILRQLKKPLFLWFSFLIIWFLSDFAILKSLGVQRPTLGLVAESFLSSYRLSLAYLMSFYILLLWLSSLAALYFLAEVVRVVNKKS